MSARNEPQYLNLRLRRPASLWPLARLLTVAAMAALVALMLARPGSGLDLFWNVVVPVLPVVFLLLPGLWRNICPMAAMNQLPRVLRISRAAPLPRLLDRHGYGLGLLAFLLLASSRNTGLSENAQVIAVVLGAALTLPLLGGLMFVGKSGFCGSICPLRPVQGLYGQTPFAHVENSHCRPCVGCDSNCPDLKPGTALRDELADPEAHRGRYVKAFAGSFPGFVLAVFTVPPAAEIGLAALYTRIGLYMLASLGVFFLLDSLARLGSERTTAVAGAAGFSIFYWFNVPVVAGEIADLAGGEAPAWAIWEGRVVLSALAVGWLVRTFRKSASVAAPRGRELPLAPRAPARRQAERRRQSLAEPEPHTGQAPGAEPALHVTSTSTSTQAARRPMAGDPPVPVPDRRSRQRPLRRFQVTLLPDGRRLEADLGQTLAELVHASGAEIQSGCQMGLCGCDPVYICDGAENLSPMDPDERATIERFGFPEQTRMACVTHVRGDVVISLEPEDAADAAPAGVPAALPEIEVVEQPAAANNGSPEPGVARRALNRHLGRRAVSVDRIVIIGNGIAGVTTADHIRRHHAECRIDLITEERHPFYNRTSVSRLIHDRAGMQNMYLLPDSWYEERRIVSWLNTAVTRIDRKAKRVHLGTGETLPYDRLILATGASASLPPIANYGLDGCFTLRSADDAMLIRQFAQRSDCGRAVVVGGGVLGLEAAESLIELGIDVTVVERAYGLAPTQLDAPAGRMLRGQLEAQGMEILLATSVAAVEGRKRVIGVELEGGIRRTADLLLVAAGVTPNVELARAAGLRIGRGVIVDDTMRASDPNIFAAGDVAEHGGRSYGLWPAAVEQAEVAAINAIGSGAAYTGSIVPTLLRLGGLELVSIGEPHGSNPDSEILLSDAREGHYRKLILSGNKIVGAILLGSPAEAPAVLAAIREERDVGADIEALRSGDWEVLNEAPFERAVVAPLSRYRKRDDDLGAAAP